jgi:hypothetical protein
MKKRDAGMVGGRYDRNYGRQGWFSEPRAVTATALTSALAGTEEAERDFKIHRGPLLIASLGNLKLSALRFLRGGNEAGNLVRITGDISLSRKNAPAVYREVYFWFKLVKLRSRWRLSLAFSN